MHKNISCTASCSFTPRYEISKQLHTQVKNKPLSKKEHTRVLNFPLGIVNEQSLSGSFRHLIRDFEWDELLGDRGPVDRRDVGLRVGARLGANLATGIDLKEIWDTLQIYKPASASEKLN
jgi:hypothetical protein